ncbi:MAG: hypothetical protein AMXMBFR37_20440 [Steroidobacteraceae bacterium]
MRTARSPIRASQLRTRGREAIIERMRKFTAVVERCSQTGLYVGYVPGLPGAHTQAETLDELSANLQEVVEMLLEDGDPKLEAEFVGTQTIAVA